MSRRRTRRSAGAPAPVASPSVPSLESVAKRTAPSKPVGTIGTAVWGGYVQRNEQNAALTGTARYATFDQILTNTAIVAASVRLFLNLTARAGWKVEPAKKGGAKAEEYAQLINDMRDQMVTPWRRVVRRGAMYRFHGFGIQTWTAKKRADGVIGMGDVASRPCHTIERWQVDIQSGQIHGAFQRSPQDGQEYFLPRDRMIYMVDGDLNDSPEGVGMLRHVAEPVRRLQRYLQLEGYGYEMDLTGMPVLRAPLAELNQQLKEGKISPEELRNIMDPLDGFIRNRVKSPSLGILIDSLAYSSQDDRAQPSAIRQYDLELLKTGATSQEALAQAIMRELQEIARVLGTELLLLGARGEGSLALGKVKSQMLSLQVDSTLQDQAEVYNADFIAPIAVMNGWPEDLWPTMRPDSTENRDVEALAAALETMARAGAPLTPNDPAIDVVRRLMGMPDAPAIDRSLLPPEQGGTLLPTSGGKPSRGGSDVDSAATRSEPEEDDTPVKAEKAELLDAIAKAHTGAMVSLWLPADVATHLHQQLLEPYRQQDQVEGYSIEHPGDYHVTLAYLGKGLGQEQLYAAARVVDQLSRQSPQLYASLNGLGRFCATATSDGRDVAYVSVDSPAITKLRAELVERLKAVGVWPSEMHGFVPHVTLAYFPSDQQMPINRLFPVDVTFAEICISAGERRVHYPLNTTVVG